MHNPMTLDFVLIGDFQIVVAEIEISSGTFARWRHDQSFVAMQEMLRHWRDAFRAVHGTERIAYSHRHNSGALWLNDHAFVPPDVQIQGCEIDWSPIDAGLSDHATLILDISR
jgi:exonuclease III